jgi:hypothetical protein
MKKQCSTFCWHMISIASGEHLGNAIVCLSLLKVLLLLRHLPTLAMTLSTLTLLLVTATRNWKSVKMLNGLGISLNVGGTRPTETITCNIGKQMRDRCAPNIRIYKIIKITRKRLEKDTCKKVSTSTNF